jgi:ABC-type transporter Mla subunit MlaD
MTEPATTPDDRAQAALQQLIDAVNATQAEYARLHETSENASQQLAGFADAISAAADTMRAALRLPEQSEAEGA